MEKTQSTSTKEKLEKYYNLSNKALNIIQSSIVKGQEEKAKEVLEMVEAYLKDAKHFEKQGNLINAFAAINYAHGWIDASCRLGIFKVNDNKLFAVDKS